MHYQFVKYVAVLFVLSGCAINNHLKSVPSSDADFALPPSELAQKFNDIRRFDERHGGIGLVPLQELESAWGKPDRIEPTDKTEHTAKKVHLGSEMLLFVGSSALLSGIVVGVIALTPNPPPEEYIWTKGPYTITSTVGEVWNKKKLQYWNWEYQGKEGSQPVIEHKPITAWFHSFGISRGGAGFSRSVDADDPMAGLGFQISIGRLLDIPLENTRLQLAASFKYAGKSEKDNGQTNPRRMQVTNYILEAAPIYRWPNSKWMAGAGLTYYTGSEINFNFRKNEKLDDNFGVVGILEYAFNNRYTLGSRLDFINQETPSGLEYNGSSFGLYAKGFFN